MNCAALHIASAALAFCLQSAASFGDDAGWEEVFRDDFSSTKALAAAPWAIDSPRNVKVIEAAGGKCLEIKAPAGAPAAVFARYRHQIDRSKEYRIRARLSAQAVEQNSSLRYNRGVVVFGSFLARDGQWVRGGSFGQGSTGTTAFGEMTSKTIMVFPGDAHYLQIMLGVEGQGAGLFDWVVLEHRPNTAHPTITSPADGQTVQTRHPLLKWESPIEDSDVCVQLRRSPDEAARGFDLTDSNITEMQVDTPMESGTWHWRVRQRQLRVESFVSSEWRSFTVGQSHDGPPLVKPLWTRQGQKADSLTFYAGPDSAVKEVSVLLDGKPAGATKIDGEGIYRIDSPQPIPQDGVAVVIEARDANGASTTVSDFYRPPCPAAAEIALAEDGSLTVDGKPFFPVGAYCDASDTITSFDSLIEAGFNMTHDYSFESTEKNFTKRYTDDRMTVARKYLEDAHKAGLKVFMGLPREKIRKWDDHALRRFAAGLRNQPALLAWYLYDEPEMQGVGMHRLVNLRDALRSVDGGHPAVVLTASPELSGVYMNACDILWVDPYPLDHSPPQALSMVSDWVTMAGAAVRPGQPVWAVIGAHDIRYFRNAKKALAELGAPDRPSRDQLRCMTHLALAAGAKGLVYYWGPSRLYNIKDDAPEVWKGICDVIGELKSLTPFLQAGPKVLASASPHPVKCWYADAGGQRLVVLVNSTPAAAAPNPAALDLLSDASAQGQLRLAPYEVKMLRGKAR